jgi:heme oxygenase (biliverdin-IX-beta and delta-forming)
MLMHSSALQILRTATGALHSELENGLLIARPHAGLSEYLDYVRALYGWMLPVEKRLWQAEWPSEMNARERAQKCSWMEQDFRFAGTGQAMIAALPTCTFSPKLESMPQRVGLAYVIEGSQLGTQVLRKALAPHLKGWSPRWLQGYGALTSTRWKTFITCAEAQLDTASARAVAADAACDAFRSLTEWFKAQGVA